jgi:hypothetical protein
MRFLLLIRGAAEDGAEGALALGGGAVGGGPDGDGRPTAGVIEVGAESRG